MADRPNILVIMSDQHSPHFLGIDRPHLRTPALDSLAADGVIFDAAYTPQPICVPARMAFMATRYPHEIDVLDNLFCLDSYAPTFAHRTVAAGYDTRLIGRMHFNGSDQLHGFEQHRVGDVSSSFIGGSMDLGRFIYNAGPQVAAIQNSGAGVTGLEYFDDAVADDTVQALGEWRQHKNADADTRPFAYVVGFYRPHSPYRAPRELFDLYDGEVALPDQPAIEAQSDYVRNYYERTRLAEATDADRLHALTAYCALVTSVDRRVGHILAALDEARLTDDTVVIYTSDHGDHAGEHHLWWKQSFHESSVRVPLLVRDPGGRAGMRASEPVSLMDVAATVIDYAGADPLPATRARSLRSLIEGERDWQDRPVFSEMSDPFGCGGSRMVRRGRWKYAWYSDEAIGAELYDLQADPDERDNRADDPQYASTRDELHALLFADGWDPQRVTDRARQRREEIGPLKDWYKALAPDEPGNFLKTIPVDVNRAE